MPPALERKYREVFVAVRMGRRVHVHSTKLRQPSKCLHITSLVKALTPSQLTLKIKAVFERLQFKPELVSQSVSHFHELLRTSHGNTAMYANNKK